jgi:hypothetical protein
MGDGADSEAAIGMMAAAWSPRWSDSRSGRQTQNRSNQTQYRSNGTARRQSFFWISLLFSGALAWLGRHGLSWLFAE